MSERFGRYAFQTITIRGADDTSISTSYAQARDPYELIEEVSVRGSGYEEVDKRSHRVTLDVYDKTFFDQIITWRRLGVPCTLTLAGVDRSIYWDEPVVPRIEHPPHTIGQRHTVRVVFFTSVRNAAVSIGDEVNLISAAGWTSSDDHDPDSPWTHDAAIDGAGSVFYNDTGVFNASLNSSTGGTWYEVAFINEGVLLELRVPCDSKTGGGNTSRIRIEARDASSVLGSIEDVFVGGQVAVAQIETPAGTTKLRAYPIYNVSGSSGSVVIRKPTLKIVD